MDRERKDKELEHENEVKQLDLQFRATEVKRKDALSQIDKLNRYIDNLQKEFDNYKEATTKSNKMQVNELNSTILGLENEKFDLLHIKEFKEDFDNQKILLETSLAGEKKDKLAKVNELEREKIEMQEKLRREMLYKIKETKANLLALNDEQLQTTTRLTILQNH